MNRAIGQQLIGQIQLTEGYRIGNYIYTHIYEKAWGRDLAMTHRLVRVISKSDTKKNAN